MYLHLERVKNKKSDKKVDREEKVMYLRQYEYILKYWASEFCSFMFPFTEKPAKT